MAQGIPVFNNGTFMVTDDTHLPEHAVHHFSVRWSNVYSKNGNNSFIVGGALKENAIAAAVSFTKSGLLVNETYKRDGHVLWG